MTTGPVKQMPKLGSHGMFFEIKNKTETFLALKIELAYKLIPIEINYCLYVRVISP